MATTFVNAHLAATPRSSSSHHLQMFSGGNVVVAIGAMIDCFQPCFVMKLSCPPRDFTSPVGRVSHCNETTTHWNHVM